MNKYKFIAPQIKSINETYYKSLSSETITETIECLNYIINSNSNSNSNSDSNTNTNSTDRDFLELVLEDPQLYISVIEFNPSDLYPIKTTRTLGNLFVSFSIGMPARWIKIGFMDNNYTDLDVLNDLKTNIKYYLEQNDVELKKQRQQLNSTEYSGLSHGIYYNEVSNTTKIEQNPNTSNDKVDDIFLKRAGIIKKPTTINVPDFKDDSLFNSDKYKDKIFTKCKTMYSCYANNIDDCINDKKYKKLYDTYISIGNILVENNVSMSSTAENNLNDKEYNFDTDYKCNNNELNEDKLNNYNNSIIMKEFTTNAQINKYINHLYYLIRKTLILNESFTNVLLLISSFIKYYDNEIQNDNVPENTSMYHNVTDNKSMYHNDTENKSDNKSMYHTDTDTKNDVLIFTETSNKIGVDENGNKCMFTFQYIIRKTLL
jgi:hypothetical protein